MRRRQFFQSLAGLFATRFAPALPPASTLTADAFTGNSSFCPHISCSADVCVDHRCPGAQARHGYTFRWSAGNHEFRLPRNDEFRRLAGFIP